MGRARTGPAKVRRRELHAVDGEQHLRLLVAVGEPGVRGARLRVRARAGLPLHAPDQLPGGK
eukprot:8011595-Pyramimonas_sp.AAC.1